MEAGRDTVPCSFRHQRSVTRPTSVGSTAISAPAPRTASSKSSPASSACCGECRLAEPMMVAHIRLSVASLPARAAQREAASKGLRRARLWRSSVEMASSSASRSMRVAQDGRPALMETPAPRKSDVCPLSSNSARRSTSASYRSTEALVTRSTGARNR
eukprot:scaffold105679_cov57-Phaeocystis_antarctica.AAC.1